MGKEMTTQEKQTTSYTVEEIVALNPYNPDILPDLENNLNHQRNEKFAGTVNWGTATVVGIFAGLLYGGSKEAAASVSKDAEVTLKMGSTSDKREQYRLMRDAMEKRFVRIAQGSIVGGVRLGMFTAGFYGLQNWIAEKRGVHDVYNIAAAGSATAATFGLIMPGTLRWRARNVMMGSILGAAVCFPIGWVHLKLIKKANEERLSNRDDNFTRIQPKPDPPVPNGLKPDPPAPNGLKPDPPVPNEWIKTAIKWMIDG